MLRIIMLEDVNGEMIELNEISQQDMQIIVLDPLAVGTQMSSSGGVKAGKPKTKAKGPIDSLQSKHGSFASAVGLPPRLMLKSLDLNLSLATSFSPGSLKLDVDPSLPSPKRFVNAAWIGEHVVIFGKFGHEIINTRVLKDHAATGDKEMVNNNCKENLQSNLRSLTSKAFLVNPISEKQSCYASIQDVDSTFGSFKVVRLDRSICNIAWHIQVPIASIYHLERVCLDHYPQLLDLHIIDAVSDGTWFKFQASWVWHSIYQAVLEEN